MPWTAVTRHRFRLSDLSLCPDWPGAGQFIADKSASESGDKSPQSKANQSKTNQSTTNYGAIMV
jgi:hypothetical protein